MKPKLLLSTFFVFSILFNPTTGSSQDGYWQFKEIIHGNYFGSTNQPDKIELDANEGIIEFSIRQKNDCTDRYQFTYRFLQDMTTLEIPKDPKDIPTYSYEFELRPLSSPCYDPNESSYSNPSARVTHWNSTSGLLGLMKKNKVWTYKYHQQFIDEGSVDYYAYKTSSHKTTGKGSGEFEVRGPNAEDVDYYLKTYPGIATDFRILFKGQSSAGKEEAFYFDVLFVYELVTGSPVVDDPCDIKEPDCSCCPGTVPVWNFQTNKGDCICPEGEVWDKMQNRCIKGQ